MPTELLVDFTLADARRFYSSAPNPVGAKGLALTLPQVPKGVRNTTLLVNGESRGSQRANPFTSVGAHRVATDITLANARRFYSSTANPVGVEALTASKHYVPFNPFTLVGAHTRILIDFTLANARQLTRQRGTRGSEGVNSVKTVCPH